MQKNHAGNRGFALISMLIALVALTALATGGFLVASSDLRVSQSHTAGTRAFHVTDAAMYEHMGSHRRGDDTLSYTYPGGSATVAGELLLDIGDGNTLHRLEADGTHSPAEGGTSVRNVSVVAMLHDGGLKANAAITAGSGLFKNGASGELNGNDQATTTAQCPAGAQPSVAGVAVGPGGYAQNGAQPVPDGNPPVDDTQSGLDHLLDVGLDWAAITSGSFIVPDFTVPPDAWPNFATLDPDWWPAIYITGSAALDANHSGRGTIIVEDNLTLNGSFVWDGILLVGGTLTSDGKQTVQGMAVAAMNMLLGQAVPQSSIGNGNKEFSFNSCWVQLAAQQFAGGLIQVPGTWSEGM